jgi:hypothetical protein
VGYAQLHVQQQKELIQEALGMNAAQSDQTSVKTNTRTRSVSEQV